MRSLVAITLALSVSAATLVRAQVPGEVDRLATLGQAWGLLKYFHGTVARGPIDWDSALVATVPRVRSATTPAAFQSAIQALLDAAGPVVPCECRPGPDSLRRNVDFRWIDAAPLSAAQRQTLGSIRDNPHRGPNRFVSFRTTALFAGDTAFNAPEYPGEGVRLLALFRFWNGARYWFPYLYVNDGDWNDVLREFIPRMLTAPDARTYHLAVHELTARLNDAHVGASSPVILAELGGRYPAIEVRTIEGRLVVTRLPRDAVPDEYPLRVGDVITHVDGRPVAGIREERSRYVAAGNPAVFDRKLVTMILRTNRDSSTYGIERNGQALTRAIAMPPRLTAAVPPVAHPVSQLAYILPNTNIGYVNMGDINPLQVDSALSIVRDTDGIVMDVRNYPRGTMYRFAEFFNPDATPFVLFAAVDSTSPGQVRFLPPGMAGRHGGNPAHYRGRVAILIDERTQSHAEFSAMALRTAPENRVIGSQSAGADGNLTTLLLPSGIRTVFTGLGVYYPDGRKTQRVGIVPDIEVRPTVRGIRAGRDEVLERALAYLRTGR